MTLRLGTAVSLREAARLVRGARKVDLTIRSADGGTVGLTRVSKRAALDAIRGLRRLGARQVEINDPWSDGYVVLG